MSDRLIIVETWKHISSFDKCIMRKLSNVVKFKMLRHGIQFSAMYVESSVSVISVSKAYKHLTLCGSSKYCEISK